MASVEMDDPTIEWPSAEGEAQRLIAVFCVDELPGDKLTALVSDISAQSGADQLSFISSQPQDRPQATTTPINGSIQSAGLADCTDAITSLFEMIKDDKPYSRYFIVLDKQGLSRDDQPCWVGDVKLEHWVRVAWMSTVPLIRGLQQETIAWPDLWLEAAIHGGVISESPAKPDGTIAMFQDDKDAEAAVKGLEAMDKKSSGNKDRPYACFVTGQVPLQTINELLKETENPEVGGLCILASNAVSESTRTTQAPFEGREAQTSDGKSYWDSPFYGRSLSWIFDFVARELPESSLHADAFLVLDEYTARDKSVLMVRSRTLWNDSDDQDDPESGSYNCIGTRLGFAEAHPSIVDGAPPMEELADGGAIKGDGVYRW